MNLIVDQGSRFENCIEVIDLFDGKIERKKADCVYLVLCETNHSICLVFSSFIGAEASPVGYAPIAPKQAFADLIADPSAPLGFRPSIANSVLVFLLLILQTTPLAVSSKQFS